jgi:uncharacterized membrane protein SpoIIM required for sporulation
MNLNAFVRRHRPRWERLEHIVTSLERRRLRGANRATLQELGRLYRACAGDLAFAQTYYQGTTLAQFLHQLVGRAHHQIYRTEAVTLPGIRNFFRREVPRAARQSIWAITLAMIIFLTAFALGLAAAEAEPRVAELVLPAGVIEHIYAGKMWTQQIFASVPASVSTAMIFTNNISIAFLCFVGGMTLGTYTAFILVLNGFVLGVAFKLCSRHGLLDDALYFIASHGFVELSVFIVAGAGGFVLASAILSPGDYSRFDALHLRGRIAVRLAMGALPPLLAMGIVESFISPADSIPGWVKIVLGLVLLGAYWSYLLLGGQPDVGSKNAGLEEDADRPEAEAGLVKS